MHRAPRLLIAAFALVTCAAGPVAAQTMRAELATAFQGDEHVVVDHRLWTCRGTTCVARGEDPRPAVACRKLARKIGPIARFSSARTDLDADSLAACNKDRR